MSENKLDEAVNITNGKEVIDYVPSDYKTFVIFGSFLSKLADPGPLALTGEGYYEVTTAVEEGLRADGIITGRHMTTGVSELLYSQEEARDNLIWWTQKQPKEFGVIRSTIRRTLLWLYKQTAKGIELPHRY